MRIVAFTCKHDSSVCCINDGVIEFFCKEERISRSKRDASPFLSLELLKEQNLGKIDYVLYHQQDFNISKYDIYNDYFRKHFNISVDSYSYLNHHLSHAMLAFYNSGFESSLVYVADRGGSFIFDDHGDLIAAETESIFSFKKNQAPTIVYKNFVTSDNCKLNEEEFKNYMYKIYKCSFDITSGCDLGLVNVYEAATTLIGESVLENGKTMGLSSYGSYNPNISLFKNCLPDSNMFEIVAQPDQSDSYYFKGHSKLVNKHFNKNNYHYYADKAKQVQVETQSTVLKFLTHYTKKLNIDTVCISGGYGLNIVNNGNLIKQLPHINFFFEPVSDDTGISIGAAIAGYNDITKYRPEHPVRLPKDNFFHFYKEESEISAGTNATLNELCELIIQQKSIAIFDGNPEVGPRALGHRSIIFDPRNKNSKDIINRVKKREWYRPFAGIILEEEFQNYFHTYGLTKSEHMTINFDCKENMHKIAPGIVHVDNTCRIQTISKGFMYDLLKRFFELTGCPMIMNTSFNLAGEALVQTKEDAINTFNSSELDGVFFVQEKKLILKRK
jgi:carbamoyltransferase